MIYHKIFHNVVVSSAANTSKVTNFRLATHAANDGIIWEYDDPKLIASGDRSVVKRAIPIVGTMLAGITGFGLLFTSTGRTGTLMALQTAVPETLVRVAVTSLAGVVFTTGERNGLFDTKLSAMFK